MYPHSQRSDPFPLTVSDCADEQGFNNIDQIVADGRASYYAGNGALYDQEEDFAVYEDEADANAYVPCSCRVLFMNALTRCFVEQDTKQSSTGKHAR